jgi:hypothetical protein
MPLVDFIATRQWLNPIVRINTMLTLSGSLTFDSVTHESASRPWGWILRPLVMPYWYEPRYLAAISFTIWALIGPGVSQAIGAEKTSPAKSMGYAGSVSCQECHEKFYQLWSTSRHGLAMQPYTAEFAKKNLTPQPEEVKIGKSYYRADIAEDTGWILEKGPRGQKNTRSSMLWVERTSTTF